MWRGKKVLSLYSEKPWTVDGFLEEGEPSFLKGVAPSKETTLQWVAPHPKVHGWHKLKSVGYYIFKRNTGSSEEMGKEVGADSEGVKYEHKYDLYMKFSVS